MSFYLTLPSNASMNEYPNNTQTDFTTLFKQPIVLDSSYEVALTEISYSSIFTAELGRLEFPNPFDDILDIINIKTHIEHASFSGIGPADILAFKLSAINGISTETFVDVINKLVKLKIVSDEYSLRYSYGLLLTEPFRINLFNFYTTQSIPTILVFKKFFKTTHTFEVIWGNGFPPSLHTILTESGG